MTGSRGARILAGKSMAEKRLYLLDGMALVYRAHFALAAKPIYNSKGVNTSALYGFTQTLLDIIKTRQPTHLAVAFDTSVPTQRHRDFPDYKIQREEMPEDISFALPHVRRLLEAFRVPALICDGYEADDIIGTLAKKAEADGFETFMVTPDKDFGQLVSATTFLFKPSRMGDAVEILGVPEILAKWGIQRTEQVIDILALWGDASDNIPGVPGIGEKTAAKLITQFGSVENLLSRLEELKGKQKEALTQNREIALLSKRLATINIESPCLVPFEELRLQSPDEEKLKALFVEFEFNTLGRRIFGDSFHAAKVGQASVPTENPEDTVATEEGLESGEEIGTPAPAGPLRTRRDSPCRYLAINSRAAWLALVEDIRREKVMTLTAEFRGDDPKSAVLLGLGISVRPAEGFFVPVRPAFASADEFLTEIRPLIEDDSIAKLGHDVKPFLIWARWRGVTVRGDLFDGMVAHSLVEPEMRHGYSYVCETLLRYSPIPPVGAEGGAGELALDDGVPETRAEAAAEKADLIWQLRDALIEAMRAKNQEKLFIEVESPLVRVLVDMEFEGIRIDGAALAEFGKTLEARMIDCENCIYQLAGRRFNLNSPKQLGEILFDELKLAEKPKKTKTGQYSTNEQTLLTLAADHELVRRLLEFRTVSKLKSTYVDALPPTISSRSGRVHTTYQQVATATGRLNSQNPNLQNIPIRTEQGKEIRKAFVPRDENFLLLSADYSQIELRIIAALSKEQAMIEAFASGTDIHTATAARVYGVFLEMVTEEMRRKAKMVNYGIAYGISAFGLAQRLSIPRKEAATIIEQYFAQFPGIARYMTDTVEFCRRNGFVETVSGRRRYLRDIRSSNATVRGSAERNAINAPIQGTAADMIKIAMNRIHARLASGFKSRMLLQVHDELVFDVHKDERDAVSKIVHDEMRDALDLGIPIVVEVGIGTNWLQAH
jgi:DNA polymerase-1